MTRRVLLSDSASREYEALAKSIRARLYRALTEYAVTGRGDVKRLHGTRGREDLYRLRVGDYRVIFALSVAEVRVTRIIHRGQGYAWL